MKKIGVIGHFGGNRNFNDGQTVKTQCIYRELKKIYGKNNVSIVDTYNWKKNPMKLLISSINVASTSTDIIVLPAHKGVKVFIPMFNILKYIFKFKLHYIAIGSWLPSLIKNDKSMRKALKKVDYIYLENEKSIDYLKRMGLDNLFQMNNFKNLNLSDYKYRYNSKIFRCCIFSRIEEKKGVSDAIDVIAKINATSDIKVELNIYGKISENYNEKFKEKLFLYKSFVFYKGIIDFDKSVNTIEKHDLLLFPTLYYTEGIPGTIIDAFFAGVPILSSRWENYGELLEDGVTGLSYEMGNLEEFYEKLNYIIHNRNLLKKMRENCKKRAVKYTPAASLKVLVDNIEEEICR